MWRKLFGEEARIIGIDLNPQALRWKDHGFEIIVGDQSDPEFWDVALERIGKIDVLIDDGGHTYRQQIQTLLSVLQNVNDGGLVIVEDTHTSYMRGFGPKRLSLVRFAHSITHSINRRFSAFLTGEARPPEIWSVEFFESVVAFRVDRRIAGLKSEPVVNSGMDLEAVDYRYRTSKAVIVFDRVFDGESAFLRHHYVKWLVGAVRARLVGLTENQSSLRKAFSRARDL